MNQLPLPQQIARMDAERLRTYRENLDFYNGIQWQGRTRPRERRLTFNYAKVLVGKLTSYLMSGMTTVVEPVDALPESAQRARRAQEALRRIYEENYLETMDFDTELDTAILGDGCYKVPWDSQEERVRISAPDVQGLYAWWVGDDPSRIWRIVSRYRLSLEEAAMLYGIEAEGRKQVTVLEAWSDEVFQLWVEDALVQERANPLRLRPIRRLPQPAGAQGLLGRVGHTAAHGAGPGAEPRPLPALHDHRALRQSHRRAGGRRACRGHRRAAGCGVGAAGEGARLPSGPAARRRRTAARGLHRVDLPHRLRPLGGAQDQLRRQPPIAVRHCPGDGDAPPGAAHPAQTADPHGRLQAPQRDGPAHPGAAHR